MGQISYGFFMRKINGKHAGKKSWPELVGESGETTEVRIQKENPYVIATVLREGSPLTDDFRCDRVRVFVDGNGKVTQVPNIG